MRQSNTAQKHTQQMNCCLIHVSTDSVGGGAMNQRLSEQRTNSVRDYLLHETIPAASMTSRGIWQDAARGDERHREGRQQNRRVELVVSGEIIRNSHRGRLQTCL